MTPAQMIYAAMKVDEWNDRIEQKAIRENALKRREKRLEKRKRLEERNEALRNMLNRR